MSKIVRWRIAGGGEPTIEKLYAQLVVGSEPAANIGSNGILCLLADTRDPTGETRHELHVNDLCEFVEIWRAGRQEALADIVRAVRATYTTSLRA